MLKPALEIDEDTKIQFQCTEMRNTGQQDLKRFSYEPLSFQHCGN